MTNTDRGFTFVELMVVLVIIGVALAITVPMGVEWISDYKFSAGCREFINAAQVARVKSIGGPITLNVSQVAQGTDSTHFVFTVSACTLSTTPVYNDCDPNHGAQPFEEGDYITVAGINNPDFLNGKIFLITDVSSPWTATKTTTTDGEDVCSWPQVTVTAKSCMENNPSTCIEWPASVSSPQSTTTGMIRVASCLKFVPFAHDDPDRVHFTVVKSGNSMECRYDPQWMDVRVLVPDPSNPQNAITITDVSGTKPAPIVFDYAGATRNQMTYTVQLRKMTRTESGGTLIYTPVDDKKSPPIVFSIMPTGRVRLGNVPNTYTDTD